MSLLVLMIISLSAFAQEKSSREIRGDKFFFIYNYDRAIDLYSRAKNLTVAGQRKLAECYKIMGQDNKLEKVYNILLSDENKLIAEDHFNYAMLLKKGDKYSESDVQMMKFSDQKSNDLRAISFMENRNNLNELLKNNDNLKVTKMEVSSNYQEFGASYFNEQIVYTSSNVTPKLILRKYNWTDQPFLRLYVADVEDGQLKNAELFDKKDNGKMHDGPATFNQSGTFMAYTKNNELDKTKDKIVELQIYTRNFSKGEWSEPRAFEHNNTAYNLGQPSLTADGQTMYFTSDMPGGFGGTDLYSSSKMEEGLWSLPKNLGKQINTEGDEMFPFFDEIKSTLYFASNGHYGLGGLDIFSSQANDGVWGKIINAGAPLNSRFDDYAFIINVDEGYFSSNRLEGGVTDDIYAFKLLNVEANPKIIKGIAMNEEQHPLSGTTVILFDETGKEIDKVVVGLNGAYNFIVETDMNYVLKGNLETYLEGVNEVNTFGSAAEITSDLYLYQEDVEIVVLEDDLIVSKDLGALIKLKPIFFNFDKADITLKASKELDKMIKVMNQFPSMEVQFTSHTDCRGTKTYNSTLSQERAKSSAEYIKQRITNPNRISGKGSGENRMVNNCECEGEVLSNCSEFEHHMNRRSEFIIMKK